MLRSDPPSCDGICWIAGSRYLFDFRRRYLFEPPPESGLAGIAERAIQAAMKEGAFDNLALRGAPLSAVLDPHDAQFYSTDTDAAMMARILKNANFRRGGGAAALFRA